MIVTHYDHDHAAAVSYVLSRVPAQHLYLPDTPDSGNNKAELANLAGEAVTWIAPESTVTVGDSGITLYTTQLQKSDNENSMCVLFQAGNYDILITGDRGKSGEKALLNAAALPDLDVLVVGHHGAKGVASLELLTQTYPEVALISVSEDNLYGHPAQDVLERLVLFDCTVLCTSQEGTITIRG